MEHECIYCLLEKEQGLPVEEDEGYFNQYVCERHEKLFEKRKRDYEEMLNH